MKFNNLVSICTLLLSAIGCTANSAINPTATNKPAAVPTLSSLIDEIRPSVMAWTPLLLTASVVPKWKCQATT
jgi:hypothetical protein